MHSQQHMCSCVELMQVAASYDWRLSVEQHAREGAFYSRLQGSIEALVHTNQKKVCALLVHSTIMWVTFAAELGSVEVIRLRPSLGNNCQDAVEPSR